MEIRSVSSIPANRPAAAAVASATAAPTNAYAARSPRPDDGQSNGGFISPVLRYDQIARVAVLYYRDTDTGETKDQIPAERVVEEYRRNAVRLGSGAGESSDRAGTTTGSGAAEPGAMESSYTPTYTPTSDGGSGVGSAPSTVPGYAASPAPGGFSGGGASVSAGTSSGGAPGGLVSVTV
ncbi:hypothetical protein [Azospirillum soli]|uniref:hypothetical protein n=1 Tax=Azospirillum soli TaxID=1304799 RepID=UPI001AEB5BB3|nr:hypothetical protein [Azospirillum soli]MBP2316206.1 hypothetical protein [Azospirillum soli]